MKNVGIELITDERNKQIFKHGFTAEHHYAHPEWYDRDQLQIAAFLLLRPEIQQNDESRPLNWDVEWFQNLKQRSRKERIIIAAALLAAELDRQSIIDKTL
ncbi:hypothetical protein [Chryseobacterium sp.]|uniref:hypothetical protein n=1 Tax=Chryseobacterium sp. TaxID=1871047 RepID=UPI00289B2BB2|nr:hypothetical protein [Chryseobacterium sp.]